MAWLQLGLRVLICCGAACPKLPATAVVVETTFLPPNFLHLDLSALKAMSQIGPSQVALQSSIALAQASHHPAHHHVCF